MCTDRHEFVDDGTPGAADRCWAPAGSGRCLMPKDDNVHFPIIKPMTKSEENGIPVLTITVPACMAGTCADDPASARQANYLLPQKTTGGHRFLLACDSHAADWWAGEYESGVMPDNYFLQVAKPGTQHGNYLGLGGE